MSGFIAVFINYVKEIVPALAAGFIISGIIHEYIPFTLIEKYLGRGGVLPVIRTTFIGILLPVCCFGSLPIAVSLHRKGARLGPVIAFLIATPATSASALIVAYRLMGPVFASYTAFSVIVMALVIAVPADMFSYAPKKISRDICPQCEKAAQDCECNVSAAVHIKNVLRFAFIEMPKDIGVELLVGVALAAFVSAFSPAGRVIEAYLSGMYAYIFSVGFGLIMYFCSTASVPLIHALTAAGMNNGAALTLLLVGPITSYGTILVLKKEFGVKIIVYYLFAICMLGAGMGYMFSIIEG